ncbi:AAA family ATPase [Candidatus Gracilibacteria bacterium]|nr:AAA family ATPase [Candidatus Gracilibacteria bacterium]
MKKVVKKSSKKSKKKVVVAKPVKKLEKTIPVVSQEKKIKKQEKPKHSFFGFSRKDSKKKEKVEPSKQVEEDILATSPLKQLNSPKTYDKNKKVVNTADRPRLKTQVPGFDVLIEGGIPEGSAVLIEGGPGSGKTIFCLEVAKQACENGKKVLYMSFEEPEYRLEGHMKSFGANVEKYKKQGVLRVERFNALDIARSVEALLSEAKKELLIDVQPVLIPSDFEPDIVLIDSLSSIASAFSGESSRFRIYMEQLFRYLESHKMTSFLIREVSNPSHVGTNFVEQGEAVSFLSDGIIAIYNVFYPGGTRKRALEVVKMRGTSIDRKTVEMEITKHGMKVFPNKVLKGNFVLT